MAETLDYYFWISSDWAYFGNPRMKKLAERHDLTIRYRPIDMTTVYARTGGLKLQFRSKARQDYRLTEMRRFSDLLGMPIVMKPRHPITDGRLASRFVIAADRLALPLYELNHAVMHARWNEDLDIENGDVLAGIADRLGMDGHALLEIARDATSQQALEAYTEEAISRGVWGSPYYFFRDEPFWGQDRLDFIETTVAAAL